jgi:hypothetical protein
MLFHHGGGDYEVAVSAAATAARAKMEAKISTGKASAVALWERVHSAVPVDAVVRGTAMHFEHSLATPEPAPVLVRIGNAAERYSIHRHALGQMAEKAGIPGRYLGELVTAPEPWKRELATRMLNEHFSQPAEIRSEDQSANRHLLRSVNGQVRACLSDKFRRLDSRPLLDAFAGACDELKAIPVEGTVTDIRVALKAFLPMVFEPVPGEVMCLGVEWSNSDFGAGKHGLRAFIFRLWCANGAVMEDVLSQVHLGTRLADNIEFSNRTYMLDTKAQVSALEDVVKNTLGPKNVNQLLATIKAADEKKVEWRNVSTLLGKKLLKEEFKNVRDAFDSDDVINLPAEKSIWRVSNAISWIAGKTEDPDRKLDLQRLAGAVIHGKNEEAA